MARAQPRRRERGFTYLGLIILVTIIGLVGAATLKVDSLLRRAAAEEELLEVGAAFSEALQSYAAATPQGQLPQPPTLNDLLKDPRVPGVRRHLRKIFIDPMTGKAEWGVIYLGDQRGVLAVYSLSNAKPLKLANFDARFRNFDNKEHISDWKFTTSGQGLVQPAKPSLAGTPLGAAPNSPAGSPTNFPAQPAAPQAGHNAGNDEPHDPPEATAPAGQPPAPDASQTQGTQSRDKGTDER